jgi:flavin-dependent dehydrogenase
MQQTYDVAVVGSGPAGSACSLRLTRRGLSVALIDERAFPRKKLCGGYLNLGARRELDALGVSHDVARLAWPLHGARLHAHGEATEFRFLSPAWSLSRTLLDATLRSRALRAGAYPICGRLKSLEESGSTTRLVIESPQDRYEILARFVIGADGMHSTVARLCGLSAPLRGSRFATGGEVAASGAGAWLHMFAAREECFAVNPMGEACANVMFVLSRDRLRSSRGALAQELLNFSGWVTQGRYTVADIQIEERLTTGPLAHHPSRFVRRNVLLVGDAARFVDPFTGQGIFLALAGARLASETIAGCLRRTVEHERLLATYEHSLRRLVHERERIAMAVRAITASNWLSHRTASVLRRRTAAFAPVIDAVSGARSVSAFELALTIARALR